MRVVQVSIRELRNSTAKVVAMLTPGTEVYLTVHGRRVARLTPVAGAAHEAWQAKVTRLLEGTPVGATGWIEEMRLDDEMTVELEEAT